MSGGPARWSARAGFFDYRPPAVECDEWHVNFADPRLFCAYSGPLLAQDELQVAEHPALAAVREALEPMGQAQTEDREGATPVLVAGVERRCALATGPNRAAGRPRGLYGNAFALAKPEVVRAAVQPQNPPTRSNILAIAAPVGHGRYSARQIEGIARTAFAGFSAARLESKSARAVVHTGFWGCGAFGGNRVLMTALQALAAQMAGVEVVFHWGDEAGEAPANEGARLAASSAHGEVAAVIQELAGMGFEWGVSDGN
ncbi:MAG: hypothetical protein HY901_00640 [Deltaproteobacteria bacterium]|nr:hypothetical protein [Deltaproteobacteria bacterium]